jgi:hypothetical protein
MMTAKEGVMQIQRQMDLKDKIFDEFALLLACTYENMLLNFDLGEYKTTATTKNN